MNLTRREPFREMEDMFRQSNCGSRRLGDATQKPRPRHRCPISPRQTRSI